MLLFVGDFGQIGLNVMFPQKPTGLGDLCITKHCPGSKDKTNDFKTLTWTWIF